MWFCKSHVALSQPQQSVRSGNSQGVGRKFLGHFKPHSGSQISSESLKQGHIKRMTPTFATKVSLITVCKRVSHDVHDCLAHISTREACTVIQKLDLVHMSEMSMKSGAANHISITLVLDSNRALSHSVTEHTQSAGTVAGNGTQRCDSFVVFSQHAQVEGSIAFCSH